MMDGEYGNEKFCKMQNFPVLVGFRMMVNGEVWKGLMRDSRSILDNGPM